MTKVPKKGVSGASVAERASFHLEADRTGKGLSVTVGGIIGISDLNEGRVFLTSHGGRILVEGERLSVRIYEHNTVKIEGRIEVISFVLGKN